MVLRSLVITVLAGMASAGTAALAGDGGGQQKKPNVLVVKVKLYQDGREPTAPESRLFALRFDIPRSRDGNVDLRALKMAADLQIDGAERLQRRREHPARRRPQAFLRRRAGDGSAPPKLARLAALRHRPQLRRLRVCRPPGLRLLAGWERLLPELRQLRRRRR